MDSALHHVLCFFIILQSFAPLEKRPYPEGCFLSLRTNYGQAPQLELSIYVDIPHSLPPILDGRMFAPFYLKQGCNRSVASRHPAGRTTPFVSLAPFAHNLFLPTPLEPCAHPCYSPVDEGPTPSATSPFPLDGGRLGWGEDTATASPPTCNIPVPFRVSRSRIRFLQALQTALTAKAPSYEMGQNGAEWHTFRRNPPSWAWWKRAWVSGRGRQAEAGKVKRNRRRGCGRCEAQAGEGVRLPLATLSREQESLAIQR